MGLLAVHGCPLGGEQNGTSDRGGTDSRIRSLRRHQVCEGCSQSDETDW